MPTFATLWSKHPNVTGESALLGTRSWEKGKPSYPIRAQELANWINSRSTSLNTRTEKLSGREAFGRVEGKSGMSGRTGMVFFQNYWGPGSQGDHIDLWNGTRLTDWRTWARIHVRLGDYGLHNLGAGSDFQKAQAVWFWALA